MSNTTSFLISRYISWMHWFIPPILQHDSGILTRAQNIINAVVMAALSGPFYSVAYYLLGFEAAALEVLFCCIVMFIAPFVLKATGSIKLAREIFLCAVFFNFAWLTYHLGGLSAPTASWLITAPVAAMFLGGVGTAVFWLAMSCALVSTIYVLPAYGVTLPGHPVVNMELLYLLCYIGLFIVIVVFVLLFELTKTQGFIKLEQALKIINELAIRDDLTGSHNRRHLIKLIEQEKDRPSRLGSSFCLCLMDIDFFKRINDRYGHSAGDHVLKAFAETAQKYIRTTDSFGRYGGEEFLLMLPETSLDEAAALAERVRIGIEQLDFLDINEEIAVTVSIGISEFRPGESISQTVARADQALYRAKSGGRNRVACYDHAPATAGANPESLTYSGVDGGALNATALPSGASSDSDMENEKRSNSREAESLQYDALTGLLSRNFLYDRLSHAMTRAIRKRQLLATMILSINRFRELNDALGHEAGDLALVQVANCIKKCLRDSDTLSRWGGDEFIVILEDTADEKSARRVAKKILDHFSEPLVLNGTECFVTLSIGIALFPSPECDIDALLKKADIAMGRAKSSGDNNFQVYSSEISPPPSERLVLKNRLRDVLGAGELFLQYQPQVNLKTNQIVGVEALLRWQHPQYGRIEPARFISLAEETGIIVPIGEWVLRTACIQNRAWCDAGLPAIKTAVNLSARQLRHPGFVERVLQIIRETDIDPNCLDLEITEGLLIENLDLSKEIISELRAAGVKISIDDFGTGYSSLNYLSELPIDILKMDGSFVKRLVSGAPNGEKAYKAYLIAEAIVLMAHRLNLKVIAEAVETEQQLAALRRMKCDELQGFLFSFPMYPDEIAALLEKQTRSAPANAA
jgi:diguanylate cyclase (GGDEF)-like protein